MEIKALTGVRVLDLTQFLSGPFCTSNLGMFGAEVLKVERPHIGEQGRNDNGPYKQGDVNLKWAIQHCNKGSVTLNLKTEKGKEILTELIKVSDVIVENYAPGTIEKLGFPWEKIHEINPRIIFAQIKGYNDLSPFAKYPAMDGPIQATGGVAAQTGLKGGQPIISNVALGDAPSGMFTFAGILAALYQRTMTGLGQHVRVNMQEVIMDYARSTFAIQNRVVKRGAAMTLAGEQAPRGMFECKPSYEGDSDNWVFLMVRDAPGQWQWKNFCEAIGRPELFEDPRFLNGVIRLKNEEEVNRIVNEWTHQHDKREVMDILCNAKLPTGAVMGIMDFLKMQDLYDTNFFQKMVQPGLGEVTIPSSAIKLSDSPVQVTPAPDLGNINDHVYKDILGYSDEKIAELKAEDVI